VQNRKKNYFANQIMMTFLLASVCDFRIFFSRELLLFYGARRYYGTCNNIPITIVSVPFLALSMMGNTIIRAEGQATLQWCR
jgi:Na+-driven multidrug efflux pump